MEKLQNLTKDTFSIIDCDYWDNFPIEAVESCVENKKGIKAESEEKDADFWSKVNAAGSTICLGNGSAIMGIQLKRFGGYLKLLKTFEEEGYDYFDDVVFYTVDLGFGEIEKKINQKSLDALLLDHGFKCPTKKFAVKKLYNDIFWVARRTFKYPQDELEIQELERYIELRQDNRCKNTYVPRKTSVEDYDLYTVYDDDEE